MIYIIALVVIIALFSISFYNHLRGLEIHISASLQEIGNQLKRQAQLIPNLIESVKGYMKHEKSIFDELTKARKMIDEADTTKDAKTIDKAQDIITKAVESLKVIAESNPQIQASSLVSNMMDELRDTADKIMYSRRTFIDLSADYNLKISTIPGVWLAPIFGFKKQSGLSTPSSPDITSVSSDETKTPKVKI
ncbi:MAG: LemA family protein [Candidatus Shapirobacteria bacterium]